MKRLIDSFSPEKLTKIRLYSYVKKTVNFFKFQTYNIFSVKINCRHKKVKIEYTAQNKKMYLMQW